MLVVPVIQTVTEHPEKVAGLVAPISLKAYGVSLDYSSNLVVRAVEPLITAPHIFGRWRVT
jgi:hypothetical protein